MHTKHTRRTVLKTFAAVPVALTLGVAGTLTLRYSKPTARPLDLFGPPDAPTPAKDVVFSDADFPEAWTCREFTFQQNFVQFNPEGNEVGNIPGYIVKLPKGDIVAYSRICPHLGCVFRFVEDPAECEKDFNYRPNGPVFACPCHLSVYDIAQGGKVVSGPAPRPPRKFIIERSGNEISIVDVEQGSIA